MKKTFTIVIALALAMAFSLVVTAPVAADPGTTYYVSTTGSDETGDGSYSNPWKTIQHAVGQVSSGDTIMVASGTYTGAIVGKNVTISGLGPGDSIIDSGVPYKAGSALTTAFRLDEGADGAQISDFVIDCDQSSSFYFAVFSRGIDDVTIDSLEINDTVQGITNWGGSGWEITNNTITDTVAAGGGGIAIFLGATPPSYRLCSDNLVQYNEINASATAEAYSCPGICLALDLRYGAYDALNGTEDVSGNQILNNTITAAGANNGVGIEVGTILGDNEEDPDRTDPVKIAAVMGAAAVHDNTVQQNTADGTDTGIYFYNVSDLTVNQNTMENSVGYGMYAQHGQNSTAITDNTFTNNEIQLADETDDTETLDSLDIAGILADNTFDRAVTVDHPGASLLHTIWSSIQDAVDAASAGDTINVAAGTYANPAQIVIDKDLTITGEDKETTIIEPASGFTDSYLFRINDGEVDLSGFTFDGKGSLYGGVRYTAPGTGTLSNNIFKNIVYPGYAGIGVVVYADNVTVSNSAFTNIGRVGIWVGGDNALVTGNTYTGKGAVDCLDYGIEVGFGGVATITDNTITNCLGVASSDNSTSAGILVTDYYGPGTEATITGNTLTGNTYGIAVGYLDTDASVVEANYNNISGNTHGIDQVGAVEIDATANWWGDASGPYHATTNPSGAGNDVSDNVDYSPWWGASYIGVGHPWDWYTNDSVQEAVDAASAGDTVNVLAGTYDEQVTIGKSLTVVGAGKDQTFLKAAGSPVVTVSADDVTLQDLEITDDPYLVEGIRVVSGASTGLTVDRVDFTELGAGTGANAYGIRVTTSFTDLSLSDCDFIAVDHTEYYRTIGVFAPNSLQLSEFAVSGSTFQKIWTGIYLRSAIDGLDVTGSTFGPVQSSDFAACVSGIYIGDGDDDNFDIENVIITDNAFTQYGRGVYVWNYANTGTVKNFEIYGNNFTNSVWSSGIRFIAGLGDDEEVSFDCINVHDNVFTQNSTVGAHVALMDFRTYCELAYCDIDVTDNDVTLSGGPYTDPWTGIAFTAWEGPFTNTIIDGNVLNGGDCGGTGTPPSTGILLRHKSSEYWPSGALEMDITNNDITGFDNGIGIYDDAALQYGGLPTGSDVDINYNKIYGNALYGVVNGNSELVDATYNWWGDATGPYHEPLNTRGEGDAVSDNVLFDPWYGDEGMTTLVSHSTYKFVYDVPDPVVACEATVIPVTFQYDVLGDVGYDNVRFKFSATGPGDVTFNATDTGDVEHSFVNSGYWGPSAGFNLTADYTATTDWTLLFSEPGDYTITFSLIVAPDGEVIAGIEGSQEVTVRAVDIFDYYRRLHGSDEEVDTLDLLAAADDWSAYVVPPGFDEPITTAQLLQLADEWYAAGS